jgi:hypothetical protein
MIRYVASRQELYLSPRDVACFRKRTLWGVGDVEMDPGTKA